MSLLEKIFGLFGGSSRSDDAGSATTIGESSGVATLDGRVDATQNSAVTASTDDAWWVPRGTSTRELRRHENAGDSIDATLFDGVTALLDNPDLDLPRLPQVAERVLTMLRENDVDYRKLAEVVGQDAALTADVLRVANSVAYRGFTEIRNLDLAFARLGQRSLRALVLGISMKALTIRTGGENRTLGEELWRRSLASGVILAHLGARHGMAEADAFLIGLLHDIGHLAVLRVVHDYQQKRGRKITRPVFDRLCDRWGAHVGMRLAEAWNLPDPLPELIGGHRDEPRADDPLRAQRLLVMTADVICSLLEYGPYVPYDFFNMQCVQALGMVDDAATRELLRPLPEMIRERLEAF